MKKDSDKKWMGRVVAGRYRITESIGHGGMGAVFGAVQEVLNRDVALKVIRPQLADESEVIARFQREAQVVARLKHPNVVTVHDFGAFDEGGFFIVMERLHGDSIAARLRQRGPMGWPQALRIVRDIAAGLVAAHGQGVIHRDLKPDNIMLVKAGGQDDVVKILDFGVAKLSECTEESTAPLTGSGMFVGTPGYMAPEVIFQAVTDDPRSDLYALGLLWFEMMIGRPLYGGATPAAVVVQQMTNPPPDIDQELPHHDIPAEIRQLLYQLLSKDPDGRPASAEIVFRTLDALARAADSGSFEADQAQTDIGLSPLFTELEPGPPTLGLAQGRSLFTPPSSPSITQPVDQPPPGLTGNDVITRVPDNMARSSPRSRLSAVAISLFVASLVMGGVALAKSRHQPEVEDLTTVAAITALPDWKIATPTEPKQTITTITKSTKSTKSTTGRGNKRSLRRRHRTRPRIAAAVPASSTTSAVDAQKKTSMALEHAVSSSPRLTSELIRSNIAKMLGAASKCTNTNIKWPESGPGLWVDHCPSYKTVLGRKRLRIALDPKGGVISARFSDQATNQSRIGKCVLASIEAWEFPAFAGEEAVEITQNVTFTPCVPIDGKCVF